VPLRGALRRLAAPHVAVVVVGGLFGGAFALLGRPFAAHDEATHFFRAVQVARGDLVAERRGGRLGGVLPGAVARDVRALDVVKPPPDHGSWSDIGPRLRARPDGPPVFLDFRNTAVYPPLAYAPQAAAVALAGAVGASTLVAMYLGRLANLAAYLALVALAARRFPGSGWAVAVVVLAPMSLFQGASLSGDGPTTALAVLVGASALRLAGEPGPLRRRDAAEAVAVAVALALCKPPYALVSLAYLAPVLRRGRPARVLLVAPVAAVAVMAAWSRYAAGVFVPLRPVIDPARDVRPAAQVRHVAGDPLGFASTLVRAAGRHGGDWARQVVGQLGRLAPDIPAPVVWAWWGLAVLAALAAAGAARSGRGRARAAPTTGAVALGVAVLVSLAVVGAVYVYTSAVGAHDIDGVQGRYFTPVLPLVGAALPSVGPARRLAARPAAAAAVFGGGAALVCGVALVAYLQRAYGWL
jgi:uncharacterized membrane protein